MQVLKEELRDKILQTAKREFLAEGFLGASTREIVKKVKISKGNLYNYFQSKEDLFCAIITPFHLEFNDFLHQLWNHGTGENLTSKNVEIMARKVAEFITEHRDEFILLVDKSEGTQYAGFKKNMITAIQNHFEENLKPIYKNAAGSEISIMYIIAKNFVAALLAIAKDCKDTEESIYVLNLYLKYHLRGMKEFY